MSATLMVGKSRENADTLIKNYEHKLGITTISEYYKAREDHRVQLVPRQLSEFLFLIEDEDRILTHGFVDGFSDTKSCRLDLRKEKNPENKELFMKSLDYLFEIEGMETIACARGNKETMIGREDYIPEEVFEDKKHISTYI